MVISGVVRWSPVEEGVPELGEGSEGQLGVHDQRVARHRGGGGVLLLAQPQQHVEPAHRQTIMMMVMVMSHLSVVGSGPIRQPLKSSPSRYLQTSPINIYATYVDIMRLLMWLHLMNVVFPVEYWPTSSTLGLQKNSASSRGALCRAWNR